MEEKRKALSKKTNRLISIVFLSIFAISIISTGVIGVVWFNSYQENIKLQKEMEEAQQEYEFYQAIYQNTDEDGTYNPDEEDDYIIYDDDDTIIM